MPGGRRGGGRGNRCLSRELEQLGITSASPRRQEDLPPRPSPFRGTADRLHPDECKIDCVTSYAAWAAKNKPPLESPIPALQRKWGCARNYPQRMHTKFLLLGSVKNRFQGRPQTEWSDELIARIEELIREARDKQCIATPHEIARALEKEFCSAPGRETIRLKKRELGFIPHNVKKKPLLDKEMMRERLRFGKKYARWSLARTLVVDEKQFEEGDNLGRYEARITSPVPCKVRFKGVQAETNTQKNKVMYLAGASKDKKISFFPMDGYLEFNQKQHADFKKRNPKSKVKCGTGINSAWIIAKVLPRLHREARKALGPGPIYLWWDRASCHRSKASMAAAASIFDGVILQPPKSPDMNIMDAAVFPWMERIFAKSGAKSKEEIRTSAEAIWKELDEDMLPRCAKRVKTNMATAVRIQGGNFYEE